MNEADGRFEATTPASASVSPAGGRRGSTNAKLIGFFATDDPTMDVDLKQKAEGAQLDSNPMSSDALNRSGHSPVGVRRRFSMDVVDPSHALASSIAQAQADSFGTPRAGTTLGSASSQANKIEDEERVIHRSVGSATKRDGGEDGSAFFPAVGDPDSA